MNEQTCLPVRKKLDHRGPLSIDVRQAVYFVTIAAADRAGRPFLDAVDAILEAARFYQANRRWFLSLLLVMPDHLHMLVHVPDGEGLSAVIGRWKQYLATQRGVAFQSNYFDTRIRDNEHFAEKWNYICWNPVRRGLVEKPKDWPYVIAFDQSTGLERPHR